MTGGPPLGTPQGTNAGRPATGDSHTQPGAHRSGGGLAWATPILVGSPASSAAPMSATTAPTPARDPAARRPAMSGRSSQPRAQEPQSGTAWPPHFDFTPLDTPDSDVSPTSTVISLGSQQGASASNTARRTTTTPVSGGSGMIPPLQSRGDSLQAAVTPSQGAQQTSIQQGNTQGNTQASQKNAGWRTTDDLFHRDMMANVRLPNASDEPPRPLPALPSSIDYGKQHIPQMPTSILRRRPADADDLEGKPAPKRVRWV